MDSGCAAGIGRRPASSGSSPVQDLAAVNGQGVSGCSSCSTGGIIVWMRVWSVYNNTYKLDASKVSWPD